MPGILIVRNDEARIRALAEEILSDLSQMALSRSSATTLITFPYSSSREGYLRRSA
jgi:hypothetical protein